MKGGTAAAADTPSFNNNNNITTTSDQTTTSTSSWGTWEELLLACAVKRHGVHDWDTVAMELQAKTSLPPFLTTASNCNLKYLDLRRRFHSRHQNDVVPPDADDVHHDPHNNNNTTNIPWLDDLRILRVARQELHGYDVSIVSLQLKVKRLEEEREDSFKDDDPKPDLEEEEQQDSNRHRSENDKTVRCKPDHDNQSVNGSNSTCFKNLDHDNKPGPGDRALSEPGPLSAGSDDPSKKTGSGQSDSDSDKGSSETVAKKRRKRGRRGKGGGDSAGELRESSEAQSLVSLTKKRNGKRHRRMEVPEQQQHNNEDVSLVKSEPLIEVLRLIRAQEHGLLFERRLSAQLSGLRIGKALKWWEKGNQPNMKEVASAEDLVESLSNAGDKLVIVDFFSPGCGGCKALHPKICQLAEMNPDVQFLQVNYEEHKSMCYSLNVHVLPFFRFYRGAHGRLCSFSCTNATIKKFRDALAKHKPERCSLGPTKGLEEKELLALATNKDLSFTYTPKPTEDVPAEEQVLVAEETPSRLPLPSATSKSAQVVTAWR